MHTTNGETFTRSSGAAIRNIFYEYRVGERREYDISCSLSDGNPCLEKYCGAGKECQVTTDGGTVEAVCVCTRRCARKHRPVCASNGRVYANHCELHRAACNTGTSLTTRRLSRCLGNGEHVMGNTLYQLPHISREPSVTVDNGDGESSRLSSDVSSVRLETLSECADVGRKI